VYITLLSDARLMLTPYGIGEYVVWGEASGGAMCEVPADIARAAIGAPELVTFLASWPGTFRGRTDTWSLWYALDMVWAATGDVSHPDDALRLIEDFLADANDAEHAGRIHNPDPPPSAGTEPFHEGASHGLAADPYDVYPFPYPVPSRPTFGEAFMDGFLGFFGGRRRF
jgi:hypothetical protein